MSIVTSFNGWIMSKVINYLTVEEGCKTEFANYTADGMRTVIQDAFGYRYEITIKTVGRVTNDTEDLDKYANNKKSSFMSISTKI